MITRCHQYGGGSVRKQQAGQHIVDGRILLEMQRAQFGAYQQDFAPGVGGDQGIG